MLMEASNVAASRSQVGELRFLGLPTWIKAHRANTGGQYSLIEQVIPAGFASPWHTHRSEDESFYVIEGEMTVIAGGASVRLGAGGYAFGPRGVPGQPDPAKMVPQRRKKTPTDFDPGHTG